MNENQYKWLYHNNSQENHRFCGWPFPTCETVSNTVSFWRPQDGDIQVRLGWWVVIFIVTQGTLEMWGFVDSCLPCWSVCQSFQLSSISSSWIGTNKKQQLVTFITSQKHQTSNRRLWGFRMWETVPYYPIPLIQSDADTVGTNHQIPPIHSRTKLIIGCGISHHTYVRQICGSSPWQNFQAGLKKCKTLQNKPIDFSHGKTSD